MQYLVSLKLDPVDDVDTVYQQPQGTHVDGGYVAGDRPVHLSAQHPFRMQPDIVAVVLEYLDGLPVLPAEGIAPSAFRFSYLPYQPVYSKPHVRVAGIEEHLLLTFLHRGWPPGKSSGSPSSPQSRMRRSTGMISSPVRQARKRWRPNGWQG